MRSSQPAGTPLERPALLVTGTAQPQRVVASAAHLNVALAACAHYPDHHPYSAQDIEAWNAYGQAHGVQDLVTTAKDAARLDPWLTQLEGWRIWTLPVEVQWEDQDAVDGSSTPGSAPYLRDMTHAFSRFMIAATCWAAASAWIGCDSPSASGPAGTISGEIQGANQAALSCFAAFAAATWSTSQKLRGFCRQLHLDPRKSTRVGTPPTGRQPHESPGAHHRQHRAGARARFGHARGNYLVGADIDGSPQSVEVAELYDVIMPITARLKDVERQGRSVDVTKRQEAKTLAAAMADSINEASLAFAEAHAGSLAH